MSEPKQTDVLALPIEWGNDHDETCPVSRHLLELEEIIAGKRPHAHAGDAGVMSGIVLEWSGETGDARAWAFVRRLTDGSV